MSEVVEQSAAHRLPLDETHRRHGASMIERDGWMIPAHYGNSPTEYKAVREEGAGLLDLSSRGRIEVSGTEAVQFLNGLITNDVKALKEGEWMPAAFPNVQGRLLANARVLHRDNSFLLDTEAVTRNRVYQTLERFTLAGDFRIRDITNETALISVQGARSAQSVSIVLGEEAADVERGRIRCVPWQDSRVNVIRATHTSEDGYDLFTGASEAPKLWEALSAAGALPTGFDALEVLRIEAGLPRFGVDMNETNVVLETGLDEAVSFTKGCYIGQEIIARIHWRGHVAKRLAGLSFDSRVELPPDAKVKSIDGKEIGRITSATFSPRLERTVALAYLRYDYLKPQTEVRIVVGDKERTAYVVELPFVRGTWYASTASTESDV